VDTIDPKLNLATLKPGYGDNAFTTTVDENRVVKFTFKSINLPWKSTYGDVASSGMFIYTIRLKPNLPIGSQIKNKAAIYFDLNEPVITNSTLNTLVASSNGTTGIASNNFAERRVMIYPNPAGNSFVVSVQSTGDANGSMSMYDLSGRVILKKDVELKDGLNGIHQLTDGIQAGVYILRIQAGDQQFSEKLIIVK